MNTPSPGYLATLVRATAVLALDADAQTTWLSSLGLPGEPAYADELALEFDDAMHLLEGMKRAGWINAEAADRLKVLDGLLDAMSRPANSSLWTLDALSVAPEWSDVRRAAQQALFAL